MIWHNITKKIFNVGDLEDFIQDLSQRDTVMFTVRGNELLFPLLDLDCEHTVEKFKQLYREIHGEVYKKLTDKDKKFLIKEVQKQCFIVDDKEKIITYYPATREISKEALKLRKEFDFLLQPALFPF